jgi:hypothetical protein
MNMHRSSGQPRLLPLSVYIPILWKFWIGQGFAFAWLLFSIWLSLSWIHELSRYVGFPFAILIIAGLAYIPGYLNAFLVSSLLLDRQPPFTVKNPNDPITILIATRNEAAHIAETLTYISRQDYQGEIRVIVRPWHQPRLASKLLTGINLIMPYLDATFTICWLPGLILASIGIYVIVGPHTLFVLPFTLMSHALLYRYQRRVFHHLGLRVRRNWTGFIAYVFLYQMVMAPVSVWGYLQEMMVVKRGWK